MSQFRTQNPATGELLETFTASTDDEIAVAVDAVAEGFQEWSARPLAERTAILHRIADIYEERREEVATSIATDMGKPIQLGTGEVTTVAGIFRYYADHAERLLAHHPITPASGGSAYTRKDPTGPLLGVMPWNFPHYQLARFVAPNLALGNTMLLKHAGNCARSGLLAEEIFHAAGVPKNVYQNIFASHSQIADIIAHPKIEGVSFTGSDGAGAKIGEQAGRHVKRAVLELGGSDPFIILDDADLSVTVPAAVAGRCANGGQVCTSSKRFIVHADLYDEFLSEFTRQMSELTPGDPHDPETFLGPLAMESALTDIQEVVDDAAAHGAVIHTGGAPLDGPGYWYPPTVLTDVTPQARAYREEIFGPVAVVHRVDSEEEAIRLANDTPYGLSSSIFTTSQSRAEAIAEHIQAGMVWINSTSKSSAELPFGGVKRSGFGRELGDVGIDEFANLKLVRSPHFED